MPPKPRERQQAQDDKQCSPLQAPGLRFLRVARRAYGRISKQREGSASPDKRTGEDAARNARKQCRGPFINEWGYEAEVEKQCAYDGDEPAALSHTDWPLAKESHWRLSIELAAPRSGVGLDESLGHTVGARACVRVGNEDPEDDIDGKPHSPNQCKCYEDRAP